MIEADAIFNGPVTGGNIQAIASAQYSEIHLSHPITSYTHADVHANLPSEEQHKD